MMQITYSVSANVALIVAQAVTTIAGTPGKKKKKEKRIKRIKVAAFSVIKRCK